MNFDIVDSIIYFIFAIVIFTFQFGLIGIPYGILVGLFLAWFRYNHY